MAYTGTSPAHTGGFSQFLAKDYETIFYDNYRRRQGEYTRAAKVQKWEQAAVKEGSAMTFGPHVAWTEGQPVDFDVITQGPEKEVTFDGYALGFSITRNLWRDDLTGKLKGAPAELGKSANYSIDVLFWDILNSGFVTTYRTGIDGYALFSASHPRIDGGTGDNLGSSAALSETTLEAALLDYENLKNERGIPIEMVPKLLVIPTALKKTAQRLLMSEYRPGTANNDINALREDNLQYFVCHYLTSTTAYYLLAPDHDLRLMWRDNVEFESGDDFRTKNAMFTSTFRLAVEFFDWRGAWGSAGA